MAAGAFEIVCSDIPSSGWMRIARTLDSLPSHSRVEIDARGCRRIDPDVLLLLHEFRERAAERDIDYRLVAVPPLSDGHGGAH